MLLNAIVLYVETETDIASMHSERCYRCDSQ